MSQIPALSEISAPPLGYEVAVAELESLASAMESGELPLGDMLNGYRRASYLLDFCRNILAEVESQVRQLEGGQLKPWLPSADGASAGMTGDA